MLYYQKPLLAALVKVFFIPLRLQIQAFDAPGNKKSGELPSTGLLVVDKVIEPLARRSQISNLELLKDLAEVAGIFTK
jgi:hypothetical protein